VYKCIFPDTSKDTVNRSPTRIMSDSTTTEDYSQPIATEFRLQPTQVANTIALLDDDATVPFIARYRKEATGSLTEVEITAIRDRLGQLRELDKRRAAILKSLEERELLSDDLRVQIEGAESMAVLDRNDAPGQPSPAKRASSR